MSEPKEWKDMPDGIKGMIVKQLDLPARTCLKRCSKADKQLVDSIPLEVDEIKTYDANNKLHKEYSPMFNVKIGSLHILNEGCYAYITESNAQKRSFEFCNVAKANKFVVDTFAQILIHGNIHINHLYIGISFSEEFEKVGFKIKAKYVHIGSYKVEDTMNWLRHLDPCVEEITTDAVFQRNMMHKNIGLIPEVINAKTIKIYKNNDINDEQVVDFKARKLNVESSRVTEKGLNMLMKKWIEEDYPIGSKIIHFFRKLKSDMLLNGLDYEAIDGNIQDMNGRVVINHEKELIIKWDNRCYGGRLTAEVCPIQEHKTAKNWNDLPNELKWMIVENMDIFTRFRLKTCSKSDKRLIETVPLCIEKMSVLKLHSRNEVRQNEEMVGLELCMDSLKIASRYARVSFLNKMFKM